MISFIEINAGQLSANSIVVKMMAALLCKQWSILFSGSIHRTIISHFISRREDRIGSTQQFLCIIQVLQHCVYGFAGLIQLGNILAESRDIRNAFTIGLRYI